MGKQFICIIWLSVINFTLSLTVLATVSPAYQQVNEGSTAMLRCSAQHSGVKWTHNDNDKLPENSIMLNEHLLIINIKPSDTGIYKCITDNNTEVGRGQVYVTKIRNSVSSNITTWSQFTEGFPNTHLPKESTLFHPSTKKWAPKITVLPKTKLEVYCADFQTIRSEDMVLECAFGGFPLPLVKWKKYDGHVPPKCKQVSISGRGILTCPNFQQSDQGAYSCIAENEVGSSESQPKSIVKCSNTISCRGFKVVNEDNIESCLECYCSGKTKTCQGIKSDLTKKTLTFPETKTEVFANDNGDIVFVPSKNQLTPSLQIRPLLKEITYCSLSYDDLKEISFLKSFGRNINIPRYRGKIDFIPRAPDLIIQGNGLSLMYSFNKISHNVQTLNIRFWPGNWLHLNRTAANRKTLMRVLSNVDALLIRCEYKEGLTENWPGTAIISLESSLITEHAKSVSYVEKCQCPEGYDGLSCESCASGFTKKVLSDSSFICERIKPKPCPVGFKGFNCSECDQSKNYFPFEGSCRQQICDKKGSQSPFPDKLGKCICNDGVTGETCNKCENGFFHLREKKGCLKCWCNGVTNKCKSSSLYRSTISISKNFMGGYNSSNGKSFWLLPSVFSGNRLASYGGYLRYTMTYLPGIPKQAKLLTAEILTMDNITLSHVIPTVDKTTTSNEKLWKVPLIEDFWKNQNDEVVTRDEFLSVLSKIKAIYLEAPYLLSSGQVNLTFVHMSDATSTKSNTELAVEVEECECGPGYKGSSCEYCSEGYYKSKKGNITLCLECDCPNCDPEKGCQDCPNGSYRDNPLTESTPICKPCSCNGNEKYCGKDDYGIIYCICKPGYFGLACENKPESDGTNQLRVTISPRTVEFQKIGSTLNFNCSYESHEKAKIVFAKTNKNGKLTVIDNIGSNSIPSAFEGKQLDNVKNLEIVLDNYLTSIHCLIYSLEDIEIGHVVASIENTIIQLEPVKITNCYDDVVYVTEFESKDFICEAVGSPTPMISWYKMTKGEKQQKKVDTTEGVHFLEKPTLDQNGTIYTCIAENTEGDKDKCSLTLIVRRKCATVTIIPKYLAVKEEETIYLQCKTTANGTITWSRQTSVLPLTERITVNYYKNNANLTIRNATINDADIYMCKVKGAGEEINKTVEVVVKEKTIPPTVTILGSDVKLEEGDKFEVKCVATGKPAPTTRWIKPSQSINNVIIDNSGTLKINSATLKNEGFYACEAKSSSGYDIRYIRIEVLVKKIAPKIKINFDSLKEPIQGQYVFIHCEVLSGSPKPSVEWVKLMNGKPSTVSVNNTLMFKSISFNDRGSYECIAKNDAGQDKKSIQIDVLIPPSVNISQKTATVRNNEEFTVRCLATGHPEPKIYWMVLKGSGNFRKIYKSEISIKASEDLHGLMCVAENKAGSANESMTIKVLRAPVFGEGSEHFIVFGEIGSEVELQCFLLNGNVKWQKLNGQLQGDECFTANGLTIPSVQMQHNGTYICKSESDKSVLKNISLIVKGYTLKFSKYPKSYLVLPVALTCRESLRVETSFKFNAKNGILILKDNHEFALYIKENKLNVRLSLKKSKSFHMHTKAHLEHDNWYYVIIDIKKSLLEITIYNGSTVLERKSEMLKEFEVNLGSYLQNNFYIGGAKYEDKIYMTPSYFSYIPSLSGCISRLKINNREYYLTKHGNYSVNVQTCNVCSQEPDKCKGEGKCLDAPTQFGFMCVCPNDYEKNKICPVSCDGRGCEAEQNFCELLNPCKSALHKCINLRSKLQCQCDPNFTGVTCDKEKSSSLSICFKGDGFVRLPSKLLPGISLSDTEVIKMEFTLEKPDGLLFWRGDRNNYISIAVKNKQLIYVYFNQNVELKISGYIDIHPEKIHSLTVQRANNTAYLQLDSRTYKSSANFTTNRVKGDIYLGMPSKDGLPHQGLQGCINSISFGNTQINFGEEITDKLNVVLKQNKNISGSKSSYETSDEEYADYDYE